MSGEHCKKHHDQDYATGVCWKCEIESDIAAQAVQCPTCDALPSVLCRQDSPHDSRVALAKAEGVIVADRAQASPYTFAVPRPGGVLLEREREIEREREEEAALLAKGSDEVVNHPQHYNAVGKIEVIDFIEDKQLGFHVGNVVKYVVRAPYKNGLEDLQKARWYLDREIERMKKESGSSS